VSPDDWLEELEGSVELGESEESEGSVLYSLLVVVLVAVDANYPYLAVEPNGILFTPLVYTH
jgi:hypothetical protein